MAAGTHSIAGAAKATVELDYNAIAADTTTLGEISTTATAADGTKTEYMMMKAAEFSNIDLEGSSDQVPVVTSSGYSSATQYARSFTVPSGKNFSGFVNNGTTADVLNLNGGTIESLTNAGTVKALYNYEDGVIEYLLNTGIIGDDVTSSSSSTGLNGLRGVGTVYIGAIGGATSTRETNTNRVGTMVLKAGSSTSYAGAYIATMNVNNYAAIGTMTVGTGASVSISSNSGTVKYLDWTLCQSGSTLTFNY